MTTSVVAPVRRPLLFVATPCYGGLVTQEYVLSLLGLIATGGKEGFDTVVALQGHDSLITRSRNTLAAHFLESAATHLMFIDADIGFDTGHIGRMLAFDEEVVCGVYPLKVQDWSAESRLRMSMGEAPETAVLRYVGLEEPGAERRGDFIAAEYAGTGFMLIKREALERMINAYPETRYSATHAFAAERPRAAYALFDCEIDRETGLYLSEDFSFCRKFRAIGGKIWLDVAGQLVHVGAHSFVGKPAVRFAGSGGHVPMRGAPTMVHAAKIEA